MRRGLSVIITVVITVVITVLYLFLAKAQIAAATDKLRTENASLQAQLEEIRKNQAEMPQLAAQLPFWRRQLALFKLAIPVQLDDDKFLENISAELKRTGVTLTSLDVVKGGAWLGSAKPEQLKQLEAMGLDTNAAQRIQVAFYSVTLIGNFDKVLSAFENLKQHHRLYSIDQVSVPVAGGAGQIIDNNDQSNTPIQITGKIYSGIPADYMNVEELDRVYTQVVAGPVTRRIKASVSKAGQESLTKAKPGAAAGGAKPPAAGQPSAKGAGR